MLRLEEMTQQIWLSCSTPESRVRVWVIPNILKMVLTAPQLVLGLMSLSKRNALAITVDL